ncbi:hypothetical protein QFZ75_000642 [Streptomyces sp. V3I8]|nr:hypothetical protein [Streptomyces sp. V3I8]
MDLSRGDKEYKDRLKTRELCVGEGFASRPRPVAAVHRLGRRPVRGLRNTVLAHHRLRDPAGRPVSRTRSVPYVSGGRPRLRPGSRRACPGTSRRCP